MTDPLPEIYLGVVLAYPCPACRRFVRATEAATCGCYVYACCGRHTRPYHFTAALEPTMALLRAPSPN